MPSRRPEDGEMRKGITVLGALAEMGRKGTHVNITDFGIRPERFFGQNFIVRPPQDLPPRRTGILHASTQVTAHINDSTNWEPVAA